MIGYIYKTINLINNKIYIGQHKKRKFDINYYGSGVLISKALKKYGKNNFKCEVIEECNTLKELNEKEIYYINYYNSTNDKIGYNLSKGGEQTVIGCTKNEEERISNILFNLNGKLTNKQIKELINCNVKIYSKNQVWIPTSNNSDDVKMKAKKDSFVFSFYTKKQMSITKKYAEKLNCNYYKYNIMVEVDKVEKFIEMIKDDYKNNKIIPEGFRSPAIGTTGIFLETEKGSHKSCRVALNIK